MLNIVYMISWNGFSRISIILLLPSLYWEKFLPMLTMSSRLQLMHRRMRFATCSSQNFHHVRVVCLHLPMGPFYFIIINWVLIRGPEQRNSPQVLKCVQWILLILFLSKCNFQVAKFSRAQKYSHLQTIQSFFRHLFERLHEHEAKTNWQTLVLANLFLLT